MQNKGYIKFANKNTVEVLSIGGVRAAMDKKAAKAGTYKKKGDDKEYMVEWPNLTIDDIEALQSSPAGRYNTTGSIPYTSIINPHTLKEFGKGYRSKGAIEDAVTGFRKTLVKEHGKGVARKTVKKIDGARTEFVSAEALVAKGDFAKALSTLKKVNSQKLHKDLIAQIEAASKSVVEAASQALDGDVLSSDSPQKKRNLARLMGKAEGHRPRRQSKKRSKRTVSASFFAKPKGVRLPAGAFFMLGARHHAVTFQYHPRRDPTAGRLRTIVSPLELRI